ncbi:MAG: YceI family protein [Bacteriovoracia bacterium]
MRIGFSWLVGTLFAACFGPAGYSAVPQFVANSEQGEVRFLAIGNPSAMKIVGRGKGPEGQLGIEPSGPQGSDQLTVQGGFKFMLASLDTGLALRNRHLQEKYLLLAKYPTAEVWIMKSELKLGTEGDFKGFMQLHGVTKPVSGKLKVSATAPSWRVQARFSVQLDDFEIGVPSFAGITVAKQVDVEVETVLKP